MLVVGTIASEVATFVGLMAGAIAVGGFLGHAGPTLSGGTEDELREATVIGGLWGLAGACVVIILSVSIG
jgi:hypothetical protein